MTTMTPAFAIRDLAWQVAPDFRLQVPALDLPAGRTTLLLGPSASGKSTLLSLLGRVEGSYFPPATPRPLSGQVHLHAADTDPLDLLALDERALMRHRVRGARVGFVFQREGLFAGRSAADNVAWPLIAHGARPADATERAHALLAQVGLAPGRDVATLSGGERKRLALARTLALDPPVLLLDEPFTGLDPKALAGLTDVLAAIAADPARTVVMVTHQREDIERLGDHVVLMKRGAVALTGPRADLADALEAFLAGRDPGDLAP